MCQFFILLLYDCQMACSKKKLTNGWLSSNQHLNMLYIIMRFFNHLCNCHNMLACFFVIRLVICFNGSSSLSFFS